MRKVEALKAQMLTLTREEFDELKDWLAWDEQIEAEVKAGKLDQLALEAKTQYQSDKARRLLTDKE